MKHLILIGGDGAVGRDLVDVLQAHGAAVDVVERGFTSRAGERSPLDEGSVAATCRRLTTENSVWVNLAGIGDAYRCELDPSAAVYFNVETPVELSRQAADADAPLIHLSTWEVYGRTTGELHEDSGCAPNSVYARTKYLGETAALETAAILGGRCVAVRIGPVLGPSMRAATAARAFYDAAARGEPLHLANGGAQARQFLDYRDLADALVALAAARSWPSAVYNIAHESQTTIDQLAKLIASRFPGTTTRHGEARRTEPSSAVMDVSRARAELGWCASRGIDESVEHLIGHWSQDPQ